MGKHDLGGNASIEVTHVSGSFAERAPAIDNDKQLRTLKFTDPVDRTNTADIKFKFKTTNVKGNITFGIKQFVTIFSYGNSYKGNKDQDGTISQRFHPADLFTLDVSTRELTVLFDSRDLPTGAKATAPQAPFYSNGPAVVKDGADIELSIQDMPGAQFALELRNVSTDRINYLANVDIKQKFLTVLTAVKADKTHIPLEAAYWQTTIGGDITWGSSKVPDISKVKYKSNGIGSFHEIKPDFLLVDFGLLTNASLTANDCMVQKFNDAMFTVRGMYKRQDFNKPTHVDTTVQAKGYRITQSPTI